MDKVYRVNWVGFDHKTNKTIYNHRTFRDIMNARHCKTVIDNAYKNLHMYNTYATIEEISLEDNDTKDETKEMMKVLNELNTDWSE